MQLQELRLFITLSLIHRQEILKASVACAYILTERGNTAANNVSSDGSTYGLKIFDTNGTTVILNSQRTNGVMNIVAGIPSGNAATAGGSTLLQSLREVI